MNPFDTEIIYFINQFSQSSWTFDSTVAFISGNSIFKGVVLLSIFWWGWFTISKHQQDIRLHLIASLYSCFIAIASARALALLLPMRLRPLHEEGLDILLPYGMEPAMLGGWSSFPSDHAVLFFALSTGMFYISKKVGIFALVYTTIMIALPRIYLGLHYPTDILAGAVFGIAIALLCQSTFFLKAVSQPTLNFSNTRPQTFYPIFFIVTYQIADMFNGSRDLVEFLAGIIKTVL